MTTYIAMSRAFCLVLFLLASAKTRPRLKLDNAKEVLVPLVIDNNVVMVVGTWEESPVYEYDYEAEMKDCPQGFQQVLGICREIW